MYNIILEQGNKKQHIVVGLKIKNDDGLVGEYFCIG
jgi:hypothetical protein